MGESITHSLAKTHPPESKCIMVGYSATVAGSLNCADFHDRGVMVRIFNSSTGALYYKFSPDSVANIDPAATSGTNACFRLNANSSERGFIPKGMPYLHYVNSAAAGNVYVTDASELR